MDDLISRQAAIEAVHKTIYGFFDIVGDDSDEPFTKEEERLLVINKAITTRIKSLPSAQPERKRGKWHSRIYSKIEMFVCSECQHEYSYDAETGEQFYNYCPNCGADMRGEQE